MSEFKPSPDQLQWAREFLANLPAPVTKNNVGNVAAWEQIESGSNIGPAPGKTGGVWNPLNTVATGGIPNVGQGGSQGNIANYRNLHDGAIQSARWWNTNHNAGARDIVQQLRWNANRLQLQNAINKFYATWGGGPVTLPGVDPNDTGQLSDFKNGGDPGAVKAINDPLSAAASAFGGIVSGILGPLATRAFWIRAGEMVLGAALILVGLVVLFKDLAAGAAMRTVTGAVKSAL